MAKYQLLITHAGELIEFWGDGTIHEVMLPPGRRYPMYTEQLDLLGILEINNIHTERVVEDYRRNNYGPWNPKPK